MRIGLRPLDLAASRDDREASTLPPRRRLRGVGGGKTGTNALASMFVGVSAAHEAKAGATIDAVLDHECWQIDWRQPRDFAPARDARLALEAGVSNLNVLLLDFLVGMRDDAVFVLTIHDRRSWLDSIMDHCLERPPTARWRAMADRRLGAGHGPHPPEERALAERGLCTLGGYLSCWRAHHEKAIETVPPVRLLVAPTERIADEARRIAAFGGFPPDRIDRSRIRAHRDPAKRPTLQENPEEHLDERIRTCCAPIDGRLLCRFRPAPPHTSHDHADWVCDEDGRCIVDFVGRFEALDEGVRTVAARLGITGGELGQHDASSSSRSPAELFRDEADDEADDEWIHREHRRDFEPFRNDPSLRV